MAKRVAMSFTDSEMADLHKWNETGLPLSTALKWLVLDALRIMSGKCVTTPLGSNTIYPGSGKLPRSGVTTPSPPRAKPNDTRELFTSEKKEEKENTKKEESDPKSVAAVVVRRVNDLRPSPKKFTSPPYEKQVKKLLKMGFTWADMITVVEWKAEESKRKNDWGWFKPSTLLREQKFAEKLDEANAGVEVGGNWNNQKNFQDYTKGVDENGNW